MLVLNSSGELMGRPHEKFLQIYAVGPCVPLEAISPTTTFFRAMNPSGLAYINTLFGR